MADITPFIPHVQAIAQRTGIPASVQLGQIMLESSGSYAGGLSGLAYDAKNLYGIKGSGPAGTYVAPTVEYINGKRVVVMASFRKYNTFAESMDDHAEVLGYKRYTEAFAEINAKTPVDYAIALQNAKYATDKNYADKLINVIKTNNLTQYDQNPSTVVTVPSIIKGMGGTKKTVTVDAVSHSSGVDGVDVSLAEGVQAFGADAATSAYNDILLPIFHAVVILLLAGLAVLFFIKAFNLHGTMSARAEGE